MNSKKEGTLKIQTELGLLVVEPGELAVIPQNIRYILQMPQVLTKQFQIRGTR